MVPPVCPFSPEPWGHQMKQQVIGFKRNKMMYFPVKHRVNLQNALLQDAASARSFKKNKQPNLWRKNQVSKIKIRSTGTGSVPHGSGWAVTHFGVVSLCACVISWLYNWLSPKQRAGLVLSGHSIFWSRCGDCVFALKPGSRSCACSAHLPILIVTYNQNEVFPPNTPVLAQG